MTNIAEVQAFKTSDGRLHSSKEKAEKAEEKITIKRMISDLNKTVRGINNLKFSSDVADAMLEHQPYGYAFDTDDDECFCIMVYKPSNQNEIDALYTHFTKINNDCGYEVDADLDNIVKAKPLDFIFVKKFYGFDGSRDHCYVHAHTMEDITAKILSDIETMDKKHLERRQRYESSCKALWDSVNKWCEMSNEKGVEHVLA